MTMSQRKFSGVHLYRQTDRQTNVVQSKSLCRLGEELPHFTCWPAYTHRYTSHPGHLTATLQMLATITAHFTSWPPYRYTSHPGHHNGTLKMLATIPVHFKYWPYYRCTSNANHLTATLQMLTTIPVQFKC